MMVMFSCVLLAGCKLTGQCTGDQCLTLEVEVDGIPSDSLSLKTAAVDKISPESITAPEVAQVYVKCFQESTRIHLPQDGVAGSILSLTRDSKTNTWKGYLSLSNPSGAVVFLAYAVDAAGKHLYSGIHETADIESVDGIPISITVQGKSNGSTAAYTLGGWGPGGGWIFYDAGNYSTYGWRYMEAAPNTWNSLGGTDPWYAWSNVTSTLIGITDQEDKDLIGEGQSNTIAIMSQAGHTASAAKNCDSLVFNVMSDWFLPSLEELSYMRSNLYLHSPSLGAFSGNSYWASTEYSDTAAWVIKFSTGASRGQAKDSNSSSIGRVRPVRAF